KQLSARGSVFGSLRPSLGLQAVSGGGSREGWSFPSLKPVSALLHTMVPPGYTALQEERLAIVDLSSPKLEPHQNGFHRDPSRRLSDRASRASLSLSDAGDGRYGETEPMLPDARLSGEEADEEVSEEEGQRPTTRNFPKESPLAMALQILVPFLLAGFGTVSAGMVLDIVQHWEAFKDITEIFILVPALLGLKGNLEMTLASRLSTAVNVGKMDSPIEKWNLIIGNLALKQVQATVVGFLAAVAAVVLGWIPEGKFQMSHAVLLCSSSVATAFIASLLQGIIMVGVIVGSKKTGINPDNVATPIAASFGDLITLAILAWISQGLYNCLDSHPYVSSLVCAFFMCLTPVSMVISSKHPVSRQLLYSGWEPVITAMLISSIGGLILDKTVSDPNLAGIVVYTPVINGIGGNLVAIQSSRISTHLHFHSSPGEVPDEAKGCYYPCRTFCGSGANHRSAQVLLLLVIPGHVIFLYTIHLMKSGHTTLTPIFMAVYLAAALLQVFLLLCIADWMVHSMWKSGKDPDSFSIPYLTALGDLLGTAFLALSFHFLWIIGDQDSDVGD
uniref:Solute carrier family 41 member n=1 Tax=Pygocentrus nattereri TaxID=42514 RepID=A0AAR2KG07_PYGNA